MLHLLVLLPLAIARPAPASLQDPAPAAKPAPAPLFDEQADARALIAAAALRARSENRRVLVVWGREDAASKALVDALKAKELGRKLLYEYDLVRAEVAHSSRNAALAREYGVEPTIGGAAWISVLDGEAKALAKRECALADAPALLAFLTEHQAAYLEAQKLLDAALTQAAKEQKQLFLHFGAPWCPWCHRLEEWMASADAQPLLAKGFVPLKIDVDRMLGGNDVLKRYRPGKEGGIPWFVFTDAKGAALATSDGAKGNVGFPVQPDEIEHFFAMLAKAGTRITPDDLALLRKTLGKKTPAAGH